MKRSRVLWALGAVALLGACRTTPLDNIWPGCCPPAPAACPPPCAPVAATCEAVPWSVDIDERISPAVDCNPVRTQHTLVATVRDQNGNPIPGQRVEWILARYPDAVGDIVAHDDQYGVGSIAPIRNAAVGNAGNKIDNAYAISVTNYGPESIDAGNNHPYLSPDGARLPDITVNRGQSWLTITSGREGVTEIIVFVPAIRDGTRHKIWAKKIWADYDVVFPQDAVNTLPEGTHPFVVSVTRTNGSGIPGQPVEAEILDGPEAVFASTNARTARLDTDGQGLAQFTLRNVAGATGVNRVRFTALGSWYGETCPRSRIVSKRWQKPALEIDCSFPEGGVVPAGRPFTKLVRVRNTGDAPAEAVMLDDRPDPGLALVEGGPFPLNLGTLAPGQEVVQTLRFMGENEGRYTNNVSVRDSRGGAQASNSCPIEIVVGRLEIAKRCEPTRVSNGGEVRFVVTVTNSGRGPLENVMVEDLYPEGITQLSQSSAPLGTLAAGESREIEFQGRAERTGTFTNTATARADRAAPVQASCAVQVVECRLEMNLTGPDKIYYGEQAVFTLTVRNTGDGEAEGCTVRVANGGCLGGGYQDFNVGPLAPGQAFTQDWAVVARTVGPCSVTAESSCGQRCAVKSEVATQVTGLPALQLEMTDKAMDGSEAGIFQIGSTFVYRLKVENDVGTDVTPEMYVQWALPGELEFVSGRGSRDGVTVTGSGAQCRSSGFDLRVNEAMEFEIIVRVVGAPDAGMVRTVAEVRRASDNTELASDTESTSLKR